MYPYTLTNNSVSMYVNGRMLTMDSSHELFASVVEAVRQEEFEKAAQMLDPKEWVNDSQKLTEKITFDGDSLYYQGEELNGSLTDRIMKMLSSGFNADPLVQFMENLMENPSYKSREDLYRFMEHNNLPITSDGHLLAYKKVRDDYTDIHSGEFDNSPGSIITEDRSKVDDDSRKTCSKGLHFCSQDYLPHFNSIANNRVVCVKVNPRDVVSVPYDYNNAKVRCCRYEVMEDVTGSHLPENFTERHGSNSSLVSSNEMNEVVQEKQESSISYFDIDNMVDSYGEFNSYVINRMGYEQLVYAMQELIEADGYINVRFKTDEQFIISEVQETEISDTLKLLTDDSVYKYVKRFEIVDFM